MFYTIYKITNTINGKIYIGKHQTKDLNDCYMGSGKHLRHSIAKYGLENFKKEILFQFDNETDMNAKEAELVTEDFCLREDTYNICRGGQGGFSHINRNVELRTAKNRKARDNANMTILRKYGVQNVSQLEENRLRASSRMANRNLSGLSTFDNFKGKQHTDDTKRKISQTNSEKQKGSNNSQFGTFWITDGYTNKKISDNDSIPIGWYRGRKIKRTTE
jgi:hypothetical protein